ncbi:MAG: hypothetical protein UY23_C0001G0205 [Candidatus Jorgensenbacteria bacterium GW2011_GWA1_48_11]|uniref:Uncharacterized protein n=1 Tax=Candidatus Jorgensenbacteria bacterium GW2011_GWA1_48_11 TaxID=1618660 RepID=A0A0G1UBW4_9BACT|nr:MAG: hypothetical protein UY23_C0001G0205 [Candidatus Jorgensenbacteria bacterium GW2011_GWA1_48_11]KKW12091.1 MAG: hypothetical protein UY51_C0005G0333 [Candidatus Jorgensenbacteria bacterium GW2011_GWB1_49_9]
MKLLKILPVIALIAVPLLTSAQIAVNTPQPVEISGASGIYNLLNGVLQAIYIIFFVIAAIYIILAAFTYLGAGGDEEKVKSAKNKLIFAIVAIVVALIAIGASGLVRGLVTTGQGGTLQ